MENNVQPDRQDAERLLVLTLLLESALQAEDWSAVRETFRARAELIDSLGVVPQDIAKKIGEIEERTLTGLRQRLIAIRADMRNLTAALRIASPYSRAQSASSLSLAS
ncbi:MAG TPA: hypothetical protein VHE55_02245 [Fimbriimonadaceae bacterium]|nr:hypothetical protein [Fimbriimonadaceae bacterium]